MKIDKKIQDLEEQLKQKENENRKKNRILLNGTTGFFHLTMTSSGLDMTI